MTLRTGPNSPPESGTWAGPTAQTAADGQTTVRREVNEQHINSLLMDLSAQFIRLPADRVSAEIEDAQRRICECIGLDRSTLWQQAASHRGSFVLTHAYGNAGTAPVPRRAAAAEHFPWTLRQLERGEAIAVTSLDALPDAAARDRETWRRYGTVSTLVIPLSIAGAVLGALSFASVREEVEWSDALVRRLELFGQVLSNALARTVANREVHEARERLELAMEASNDGLWDWNLLTKEIYFSRRWKAMLGYRDDEVGCNFAAWRTLLHADDQGRAHAALRAHFAGQTATYELEHRLRAKDGSYRWVLARGKALRDAGGHIYRMAGSHTDISARKQADERLRAAYDELERLRVRLQQENLYLRQEVEGRNGHGRILGQSRALKQVLAQAAQVAETNSTVLLLGETGTGKELLAAAIHEWSSRRSRAMVRVNCAAIPATLLESELFGREKGAYTGALSRQIGRFEMASGSTLFLDEIGELPPEIQVKLLRVLQDKQLERLGSPKTRDVDLRVVAATNRNLEKAVQEGKFREDLYYRLNVFPLVMPPLRERREDIPVLVSAFVQEFSAQFGKNIESIARQSMEELLRYNWPGNVRELRNVIERAMITARGRQLWIEAPSGLPALARVPLAIREVEAQHIRNVLEMTAWRVRGKNGAAELLGLKPSTLESRMAKLDIRRVRTSERNGLATTPDISGVGTG